MTEWRDLTLDQIGRIVTGKTPPTADSENYGGAIAFVTPSDMDGRRLISETARCLTERGLRTVANAKVPSNSVMVSCIGSDMGKSAISGSDCVTNQQINTIIVGADFDPFFVYYNLSVRKDEIRSAASGSAQPIMNKSTFGRLRISVPEKTRQTAIASVLGALDDKIELNRRTNETLEAMARAIFKDWFVDFGPTRAKMEGRVPYLAPDIWSVFPDRLDDEGKPDGWGIKRLADICARVESGGTPARNKPDYWADPKIPWLTSGEVRAPIILQTAQSISEIGLVNSNAKLWPSGTTVVAMYGATAGEVCLLGTAVTANQACCGLVPRTFNREFLFVATREARTDLASKATGSAQQNLNQGIIANHLIIVPSEHIIAAYSRSTTVLFDKWIANENESRTLAATRDLLLPKLMSGEVRVSEASAAVEHRLAEAR
jgi:type I restriction enzyme S subunit